MGLNLETLVGILVILILLIMADGLRRMLRERNTRLRMKINPRRQRSIDDDEEPARKDFNPELPSGGARVVQRFLDQRAADEAARLHEPPARSTVRATQQPLFDEQELPEQPSLEPRGPDADIEENDLPLPSMRAEREAPLEAAAPVGRAVGRDPVGRDPVERDPIQQAAPAERSRPVVREEPLERETRERTPEPAPAARPARPATRKVEPAPPREEPALLEVIVVHLIAPRGHRFDGRELLQELLESGMRFGEMNIFHCHRNEGGHDVLQFSMANAVEPGTFDIDEMDREQFAGTTFFLKLPGPGRPLAALDRMLDTVRTLAERLGGELKDEQRSVLTPQTMEHLRQRVQEFERRLHLKADH